MNRDVLDALLICIIVFAVLMMGYVIYLAKSQSTECSRSPLIYSAKQLEKSNNAKVTCTCYADKPGSPGMRFDSEGIYPIEKEITNTTTQFKFPDINFTVE